MTGHAVTAHFNQQVVELTSLVSVRLADPDTLSAVVVAAASAVGMSAHGPPQVRAGPASIAVGMLCRDGHIVLHTVPDEGICFIDVAARAPIHVGKAIEIIARRLSVG